MDKISLCTLGRIEEGGPQELGKTRDDLATRVSEYRHLGRVLWTLGQTFLIA
jgi:hypothetical protein